MENLLFVLLLALLLNPLLWWLGRILPGERWQFLAALPLRRAKAPAEGWEGVNLTFYGFIIAGAALLAVALFVVLVAALALPVAWVLGLVALVLGGSVVASKLVARLVEGKENTFTVAGGATAGLYLLPLLLWLYNAAGGTLGPDSKQVFQASWTAETMAVIPVMAVMAALAVAFIIGEGLGRLACLSFGCCYGKPLAQAGAGQKGIFTIPACTFHGRLKKTAYAGGLEGVPLFPIQLLTALLYVNVGLGAMFLYLQGFFARSFALAAIFALGWRVCSEQLRADYRGGGRISAYQGVNLINIAFVLALCFWLPSGEATAVSLGRGLAALWRLEVVLTLQMIWLLLFFYFGVSRVTGVRLHFSLHRDRI